MKANKMPFKYSIAKKNGKQHVVFDWKDDDGNRKRKWVCTDLGEKCAKKVLNARVDEIIASFYKQFLTGMLTKTESSKSYKFTEFMKNWLEVIRPTIAETTYIGYREKVNRIVYYFDENFPEIELVDVTAVEIQQFYNDRYDDGTSANTIKHYHANIHKALNYAVKINLVPTNEAEKTERPKLDKYEATFYTKKDLERLFDAFRGDKLELIVYIAAYYGLRRSEIVGLKWSAVNFERNTITIQEKAYDVYEDGKLVTKFQKNLKNKSSYRTLPLIPFIRELLIKKKEQDEYLAPIIGSDFNHDYDDYICTDNYGDIIAPNFITDHFRMMIKKHNLKKIRFHDLRHSCASLLLACGIPLKAIQEWLGHSNFNVTANYYSHLEFDSKINSADAIAAALGNAPGNGANMPEKNTSGRS